jgi:p21-activated kinase 1
MADDIESGQKVAVKEMILEDQPDKDIIVNEILLMRGCQNRAIVNFIESYLHNGALWVSFYILVEIIISFIVELFC